MPCCRLETWEENPTVSARPGCWGLVQADGDLWGTSLRNTLVKKDSWGVSSRRCTSGDELPRVPQEWRLPRVIISKEILRLWRI